MAGGSQPHLTDFVARLDAHLTRGGYEIAKRDLDRYLRTESCTGRFFERFIDDDRPNTITERDLIAVEMLSVQVPPSVSIWLLDEGRAQITELLEHVPPNLDIWDASDDHFMVLEQLWDVLDTGHWPEPRPGNGLGPTTKSKLIAAKRPRMAPIIDSVVRKALGSPTSMWDAYRYAFSEPEYRLIELVATQNRGEMSVLRAVDVIVWMAHTHPKEGDPDLDEAIREIKERGLLLEGE